MFLLQPGAEEDQEAKGACPKTWRRALDEAAMGKSHFTGRHRVDVDGFDGTCPKVFLEDEDEWPCPERFPFMFAVSHCILHMLLWRIGSVESNDIITSALFGSTLLRIRQLQATGNLPVFLDDLICKCEKDDFAHQP